MTAVRIGGLVLAAGLSRRFGTAKLLAEFRGRPLLSHVLDTVAVARHRNLLLSTHVVVAERDTAVAALVETSGAVVVRNPEPMRGISGSLARGLGALPADLDAALVVLGDQPLVRVEVIEALAEAWRPGRTQVIRPRYAGSPDVPGHPVLLGRGTWSLAGQLEGDEGLSRRLALGDPPITVIEVTGENPDVNTPSDLHALEDRFR